MRTPKRPKRPQNSPKPVEPPIRKKPTHHVAFGLSKSEFDALCKEMKAAIRRMGCPAHIDLAEVVNDAFVMALSKRAEEWPQGEKFVPWMCELAKYAALTNRKSKYRKLLGSGLSIEELGELVVAPEQVKDPFLRDALHAAYAKLGREDRELLAAHYGEDKTITEMASEMNRTWSVVDGRRRRALDRLHALVQAILAAIILLFTKNARAHIARLAHGMSRLVPQAAPMASAMTVTIACGVLVPTSSMATVAHQEVTVAMTSMLPTSTVAAAPEPVESPPSAGVAPVKLAVAPVKPTVAPVKPIVVDMPAEQCSSADMKSTKIASYLYATALPFAFVLAPAVTQMACAGGERQTPPPQEPDDRDVGMDPYEVMCLNEQRRGNDCPDKSEWQNKFEPRH